MDLDDLGIRRALVLTYAVLSRLAPVQNVLESLDANGIGHRFYDWVRVEVTDESFLDAIAFCGTGSFRGDHRCRRWIDDRYGEGRELVYGLSAA